MELEEQEENYLSGLWCDGKLQCVETPNLPGAYHEYKEDIVTGCEVWLFIWDAETGVWDRQTLRVIEMGDKRSKLKFIA